jgi:hypothetical protein
MKNSIRNKIAYFVLYTLMLAVCFLFPSCSGPFQAGDGGSDEGNIIINLGGSPSFSAVSKSVLWPTQDPTVLDDIEYKILLTGPSDTISLTAIGRDTISVKNVTVGKWNISIKAYYKSATFLYATGENSVDVKGGQTSTAVITMIKAYYNIGDTGPGGGIIFYVDPVGFTMADTGLTAHYLEAAPADEVVGYCSWGTAMLDIPGTLDAIGAGRKNTALIVSVLGTGTTHAAQFCAGANYGGLSDWFLPSYDELEKMYQNLHVASLGGFSNVYYWSSSMISAGTVTSLNFASGASYSDWTTNPNKTRAIRAF